MKDNIPAGIRPAASRRKENRHWAGELAPLGALLIQTDALASGETTIKYLPLKNVTQNKSGKASDGLISYVHHF